MHGIQPRPPPPDFSAQPDGNGAPFGSKGDAAPIPQQLRSSGGVGVDLLGPFVQAVLGTIAAVEHAPFEAKRAELIADSEDDEILADFVTPGDLLKSVEIAEA